MSQASSPDPASPRSHRLSAVAFASCLQQGHYTKALRALAEGQQPDEPDADGRFRSSLAVLRWGHPQNSLEVLEALLEAGADPNQSNSFDRISPLHAAVQGVWVGDRPAPFKGDPQTRPILCEGRLRASPRALERLLRAGADPWTKKGPEDVFEACASWSNPQALAVLLGRVTVPAETLVRVWGRTLALRPGPAALALMDVLRRAGLDAPSTPPARARPETWNAWLADQARVAAEALAAGTSLATPSPRGPAVRL